MGRTPCCDEKSGLKKGPWTSEEDQILVDFIKANGHGSWRSLPKLAGLRRCGKSCRLRWINYLRPDIKRGPFTSDEQKSIIQLHGIVGNKWATIAQQLPGRTDNEIKNYWNTHLKKRLVRMGINPETYSPTTSSPLSAASTSPSTSSSPHATSSSSFTAARHMAQWESARLEAEARLSRESLLFSSSIKNEVQPKPNQDASTTEHADVFIRMWNSDVGESFRKKTDKLSIDNSKDVINKEEEEEEEESPIASSALTASETNDTDVETFQFYLDLAAGDDDLSFFHNNGMDSCYSSIFSSDLNDLSSFDIAFK